MVCLPVILHPAVAQISVGPSGSGVIAFNSLPSQAQGWSTLSVGLSGSPAYLQPSALDIAVQSLAAATVNQPLSSTATINPPSSASTARWNSSLMRVQTRPTGNDYTVLLATMRNNTGSRAGSVTISYGFGVEGGVIPDEEIPGHRAFYSLTGASGSWQLIPGFSGLNASATVTAALNISWPTNALLYVLWADDNAVNNDGAYTLDNFSVTAAPDTNIVITSQPQDVVVPQGEPAEFSVSAVGADPLFYQWLKDGEPLGGATSQVFSITITTADDPGEYSVIVSNAFNSKTSSTATLSFGTNPVVVTQHPVHQVVPAGASATFSAQASGSTPKFQWFRNGMALPGATNPVLQVSSVMEADAGVYYVVASNQLNTVASSNAYLHVQPPAQVLLTISNQWRYDASGNDLGTSWREPAFDDSLWSSGLAGLGNDTSPNVAPWLRTTLPLTRANGTRITTYYFRTRFTITNDFGNATLVGSNLLDDGAVYFLNGVEFHRQAMPLGSINVNSFATANSGGYPEGFIFTNVFPAHLVVTGENVLAVEVHQVDSSSSDIAFAMALAAVPPEVGPAVIRRNPVNQFAVQGETAVFSPEVGGTTPLNFQWFFNGTAIPHATNLFLTVSNVTEAEDGHYHLQVSNQFNVETSSPARLRVFSAEGLSTTVLDWTSTWAYHTGRVDLGISWRQTNYSDASWPVGSGVFANYFFTDPEAVNTFIVLGSFLDVTPTYYFRTQFVHPGTNREALLIFTNLVDDGAVFYLNGMELFRVRLGEGPVSYGQLAWVSHTEGKLYESVVVAVPLAPGTNLLAVQVHQSSRSSSDVVFGTRVQLVAGENEPAIIVRDPQNVSVPLHYPAAFHAEVFGSGPLSVQWLKDGQPVPGATNTTLFFPSPEASDDGSYVLRVSNVFNVAFSAAATLTVGPEANPPVTLLRGPYLQNATTNGVTLRWRTDALAESRVAYGTNENDLNLVASDPALKTEHVLRLTNLLPNTRYHYWIGTAYSNLAGGEGFTFLTPPITGKPTRIWVQGDSGTATTEARAVVDAFKAFNNQLAPDVWLMLGDNAYSYGTDEEYQLAVFDFMPDMLRQTLLWSTIGNHETYSASVPGPFPYLDIFSLPAGGEAGGVPSGTEYYYSFDYGNIHFVCLDSEESDRSPSGAMAQWLQEDLAANTKDWLIAYWHSPPYTKGSHNSDSLSDSGGRMVQMRENILPILEAHGVDLVLSGHSHCYERSFLLDGHYGFSWNLDPLMIRDAGSGREDDTGAYRKPNTGPNPHEGTVYIVAGSSGFATFGTLDHPVMQVSLLEMGSLVLDVNSNRLDGTFLRDTGEVKDRFTIVKGAAAESLRVATFRLSGGQVHGSWKSIPGRTYQVEASSAVVGEEWLPVTGAFQATGATSFWTNEHVPGTTLFYRVRDITP